MSKATRLTIEDARDAVLEGDLEVEQFIEEFELSWNKPDLDAAIAGKIQQLGPEVLEALKQVRPEAYAQVEKHFLKGR